ncbi:MAG: TraR/DksA family transcriptional regulator [Chloroflexota bacterium]
MEVKAKSAKLADLKLFLEGERDRLRREIEGGAVTTDEERSGYSSHMAEDANVVFEQARNVGIQRARERRLGEVEDALQRIDGGIYGTCKRCGDLIDTARLKAVPAATHCFACQQFQEQHDHWHA